MPKLEEFEKCKEEYEKLVKDTDKFIDLLYDSKSGAKLLQFLELTKYFRYKFYL